MGRYQLHDQTRERPVNNVKASIMIELGRIAGRAYEQGITLEEAYAICEAAYGDWRETYEGQTQG